MNPYLIQGPAIISFSGGRTSGYMLKKILDAHQGKLPPDFHVVFANTGKEREETLRFVHDVGANWNVDIAWVEASSPKGYTHVGYNSASRDGEPFDAAIAKKKSLPNGTQRWCTSLLKIEPMTAYMVAQGYEPGKYREVVGLRHDEGSRLLKMYANNDKYGRQCVAPLSKAKVTKVDVFAFWKSQPFDLALRPWEGNCDLCFNKGRAIRERICRDNPASPNWWAKHESETGYTFSMRESVEDIVRYIERTPMLIPDDPVEEYDVECGLHCGADE